MPLDSYTIARAVARRRVALGETAAAAPVEPLSYNGDHGPRPTSSLSAAGLRGDPGAMSPTPLVPDAIVLPSHDVVKVRATRLPAGCSTTNRQAGLISEPSADDADEASIARNTNPLLLPGTPQIFEADALQQGHTRRGDALSAPALAAATVPERAGESLVRIGSRDSDGSSEAGDDSKLAEDGAGVGKPYQLDSGPTPSPSRTAIVIDDIALKATRSSVVGPRDGDGDRGSYSSSKMSHGGRLQDKVLITRRLACFYSTVTFILSAGSPRPVVWSRFANSLSAASPLGRAVDLSANSGPRSRTRGVCLHITDSIQYHARRRFLGIPSHRRHPQCQPQRALAPVL